MPPRVALIVLGVAALLFLLVVVFVLERDPDPEEARADAQILHIELDQVEAGVFGTASFEELDEGRTRVSVEVVQPPIGDQPARIADGDCTSPGEEVQELEPVRGTPDTDEPGRSETELEVPLDDLVGVGLVLEVDALTGEDELALCGSVERPAGA